MLYSEGVEDRLRTCMVVPLLYTRIQRKPSAVLSHVPCSEVNPGDHLLDPPKGHGLPDQSLLTAFKGDDLSPLCPARNPRLPLSSRKTPTVQPRPVSVAPAEKNGSDRRAGLVIGGAVAVRVCIPVQ